MFDVWILLCIYVVCYWIVFQFEKFKYFSSVFFEINFSKVLVLMTNVHCIIMHGHRIFIVKFLDKGAKIYNFWDNKEICSQFVTIIRLSRWSLCEIVACHLWKCFLWFLVFIQTIKRINSAHVVSYIDHSFALFM